MKEASLTATSGTVTPITITASTKLSENVCQLVKLTGTFKKDGNDWYLTDGTNSVMIYKKWNIAGIDLAQVIEGSQGTATGIVLPYKGDYEIALTALEYQSAGKVDPQLSFSPEGPFEITIGDSFTEPTLSAGAQGFDLSKVKYSSSSTNAVAVDVTTGKLEINGAAENVTITAKSDAYDNFLAGSATYIITVKKPEVQPGTDKFVYVSDASTLAAGDVIILVGTNTVEETVTTYAMADQSDNNYRITEVVEPKSDGSIFPNSYVQQITLEGVSDAWNLKVGDNKYLCAGSSNSNNLYTKDLATAGDNAKAKITIEEVVVDEETDAKELQTTVVFQGDYTRRDIRFNYNNGNTPRFTCYDPEKTKVSKVKIYKKVTTSSNIKGDADGDGFVNMLDVSAVINYILGNKPTNFVFENANVDGDEFINMLDVTGIISIILGN